MKIVKSLLLKFIFSFLFYLSCLFYLGFELVDIKIISLSVLFVFVVYFLFRSKFKKVKNIFQKFDQLYFLLLGKEKKHKDLQDISYSMNIMNDNIVNQKVNIEDLEKSRSKFFGNVSHEIKTPLFILQGYVDTLIDGAVNDSKVNIKFLNKIKNQSKRLNNLMEDLIKISMIESDELKLNIQRINFQDIINSLDSDFSQILINRGDKLIIPEDISHIYIDVDKENMLTVFRNIINNAISYSDKGNVIISSKVEKNYLKIKIIDHGIGIDEDSIQKIFERFYRVDNDRSREKGGTGLGLAIVKHILLAHNININIESKLNIGTTFSFIIPISKT